MIDVKVLDFPLLSTCNLNCDNCSSYSNLNVDGKVQTLNSAKTDFDNWKPFINPLRLQLLGGEPLLHKELKSFTYAARKAFPKTDLRIYTNGLLLKKHLDLKKVLRETNCMLVISVHSTEERYKKLLYDNINTFLGDTLSSEKEKSVVSFANVFKKDGISIELRNMVSHWAQVYKKGIKPFNSNYKDAHDACMWTHCTQLYKGKLWKCTQTAFFDDLMRRINNHDDWEKYKGMYQPLSYDDSWVIKRKWFNSYLNPEPICSMCSGKLIINKHKKIW